MEEVKYMAKISPILVQKNLKGAKYPSDKNQLIQIAQRNNAPNEVMDVLNQIPAQEYSSPAKVMKAITQV